MTEQENADVLSLLQFEDVNQHCAEHDRANEAARVSDLSDEQLALKFAAKHADDLRFVDQWGKWFYWDQNAWREDTSRIARDRVRAVCREVAAGIPKDVKNARRICSTTVDNAVLTKATADRLLAATVKQWDADPFLLNTPKGIVDLRTLKVRNATNSYLEAEDAIMAWMSDWCERDNNAWESSTALFAAWKTWAERNGEYVGTQRRFAQALERHGIFFLRKNKARGWLGLRLIGDHNG